MWNRKIVKTVPSFKCYKKGKMFGIWQANFNVYSNKTKDTWEIINTESGRHKKYGTQLLNAASKNIENQQITTKVLISILLRLENINKEFGVSYFVNNDSKSTDDFIYLMKHALMGCGGRPNHRHHYLGRVFAATTYWRISLNNIF
jgi:hypothetical protein